MAAVEINAAPLSKAAPAYLNLAILPEISPTLTSISCFQEAV
jgi:hypothetical protein